MGGSGNAHGSSCRCKSAARNRLNLLICVTGLYASQHSCAGPFRGRLHDWENYDVGDVIERDTFGYTPRWVANGF